ncbi:PREDICTED: choline/ethanolamine kinase-like, partial [Priapulus caudatus]|uniref:Choline/ethanolamine kinase-like n=1 Tax=Priapulus caudatus TaxID=37621 RepID=A0ABM1EN40_PRICU
GGLSNTLYLCSLPSSTVILNNEPRQSRCLHVGELGDPAISAVIAKKMAAVHQLQLPISKTPGWIFDMTSRWLHHVRANSEHLTAHTSKRDNAVLQTLLECDIEGELQYLQDLLCKAESPVVFCHNDVQEGNVLLRDEKGPLIDRLVFIDFEYCSYNYRGFDLANHFCEWRYDYKVTTAPFYKVYMERYPSRKQQLLFIRSYLAEMQANTANEQASDESSAAAAAAAAEEEEERLLVEVKKFSLASQMIWTLWSLVQADIAKIEFDYLRYALERWRQYQRDKRVIETGR